MPAQRFNVQLQNEDWSESAGAWRFDALRIQGAKIIDVYANGEKLSKDSYASDDAMLRWTSAAKRPHSVLVSVELEVDTAARIDSLETRKLELENERTHLQERNRKSRITWQGIAAVLAVIAPIVTILVQQQYKQPSSNTQTVAVVSPPLVPQATVHVSQSLPKPVEGDFLTLRDISIWDLRGWQQVPEDKRNERYSPTSYTNYLHVKKLRKNADYYIAHYETDTGPVVDIRCLTHKFEPLTTNEFASHKGGAKTTVLKIDVSKEIENQEFLIVIEATYWNEFQAASARVETYTDRDIAEMQELGTLVLFPEMKPFKESSLYYRSNDTNEEHNEMFRDAHKLYLDKSKSFIYWSILEIRSDHHYTLEWRW